MVVQLKFNFSSCKVISASLTVWNTDNKAHPIYYFKLYLLIYYTLTYLDTTYILYQRRRRLYMYHCSAHFGW